MTATGRTTDAWTFEIKIPWSELGVLQPGQGYKFGFNLRRNRVSEEERRVSEWTTTLLSYPHSVDYFGTLELD